MKHSLFIVFLHRDSDLLDLVNSEVGGGAECSDNGLRVEALLHVRLQLLQELSSQESDGGGAVSYLRVVEKENEDGSVGNCIHKTFYLYTQP